MEYLFIECNHSSVAALEGIERAARVILVPGLVLLVI